jgi:predicted nuclease with RNAse H fold
VRLIETFPHGIACALRGQVLRARDKRHDRSHLVKRLGYQLAQPTSIDYLDATLCAHAAACFAQGKFEKFGNATEGCIVLPSWDALPE